MQCLVIARGGGKGVQSRAYLTHHVVEDLAKYQRALAERLRQWDFVLHAVVLSGPSGRRIVARIDVRDSQARPHVDDLLQRRNSLVVDGFLVEDEPFSRRRHDFHEHDRFARDRLVRFGRLRGQAQARIIDVDRVGRLNTDVHRQDVHILQLLLLDLSTDVLQEQIVRTFARRKTVDVAVQVLVQLIGFVFAVEVGAQFDGLLAMIVADCSQGIRSRERSRCYRRRLMILEINATKITVNFRLDLLGKPCSMNPLEST